MIVAMVAVRMMQMAIDQIVHMVSVGHRFVAASRSVHMAGVVTTAAVLRCAPVGVGCGDLDHMLIHVVTMDMMEMPIMQIVDMAIVIDGSMPAIRAVHMRVIAMLGIGTCVSDISTCETELAA